MSGSVYWVGADNNIYFKGSGGVQNLGGYQGTGAGVVAPGGTYHFGSGTATRIADPNPPKQSSPTNKNTGYSGGGGGYSYAPAPPPDPYAKWGGKAGYDRAVNDLHAQTASVNSSITDRIGSEGNKYQSGILDLIDEYSGGQRKLDSQIVQNDLSKRQGSAGILDMVGLGMRSGGVMLANKNASNSSAGEELARAWGDIGRRDQAGVNNQYEQGRMGIQDSEAELQRTLDTGKRHLGENKLDVINSIVSDAQTAISQLNTAAASASLPDRVDIEAKKQEVRTAAIQKLASYDATLTNGIAGVKPISDADSKAKAASLDTAGVAATNPFNYTTEVPQQFQGTGPFASELPIYTYPGAKKNNTPAAVGA